MEQKKKLYSTLPSSEKVKPIIELLKEQKANDIVALNISKQSQMTDISVVVTAGSLRHGKALADKISEKVKKENFEFLHTEGYESAQWILVDLNDIVIHIFQDEARKLYNLEALWHDAEEISVN